MGRAAGRAQQGWFARCVLSQLTLRSRCQPPAPVRPAVMWLCPHVPTPSPVRERKPSLSASRACTVLVCLAGFVVTPPCCPATPTVSVCTQLRLVARWLWPSRESHVNPPAVAHPALYQLGRCLPTAARMPLAACSCVPVHAVVACAASAPVRSHGEDGPAGRPGQLRAGQVRA